MIENVHSERADHVNRQLKTFYDSCMAVNDIRSRGSIPGESEIFLVASYNLIFCWPLIWHIFTAFDFLHSNFSKFLENIHGRRRQQTAETSSASISISEATSDVAATPADDLTDLLLALLKVTTACNYKTCVDIYVKLRFIVHCQHYVF